MIEKLTNKLRDEYGDELLESLAEHYPRQFAHIAKTTLYYLKQDEQRVQRDQTNMPPSELQPEAGSQGQSLD